MDFKTSETKVNLMRAFAGESQARNRYTFAASQAKKEGLQVIEAVFQYTAGQEKEHAEIFYNHLRAMSGETIVIDNAGYPIDLADSTLQLLRMAQHNEYQEYDHRHQMQPPEIRSQECERSITHGRDALIERNRPYRHDRDQHKRNIKHRIL